MLSVLLMISWWAQPILVSELCPLVSLGVAIATHVRGERVITDSLDILVVMCISIYLAGYYRC